MSERKRERERERERESERERERERERGLSNSYSSSQGVARYPPSVTDVQGRGGTTIGISMDSILKWERASFACNRFIKEAS